MKLSMAAELAVRGAIVLAEGYGSGPITLDTICRSRDLPKQYLTKIFVSLRKAGLVEPVRGKHGGYLLGRQPSEITLLNVIEAVEGPIALNFCQYDPPKCDQYKCPLRPMWEEMQTFIRAKLSSKTLGDCISGNGGI